MDPKKSGRPPLDPRHPSVVIGVRVPTPAYDALLRRASRERTTVSELLRRQIDPDDDDDD